MDEESEKFSNNENSSSGFCLAFASFSLAFLTKMLLIKKKRVLGRDWEHYFVARLPVALGLKKA